MAFGATLLGIQGRGSTPGRAAIVIGVVMLIGAFAFTLVEGRRPGIQINTPRRIDDMTYRFQVPGGAVAGPTYASLIVPVACTRGRLDNLRAEITFRGLAGGHQLTTQGRWDNGPQPQMPFGDDWTRFDRITLLEGERDNLGIALHYEGEAAVWAVDSRSWEVPLQTHQPHLRLQRYQLTPMGGRISVHVTIRADRLHPRRESFDLLLVGSQWMLKRQADAIPEPAKEVPTPDSPSGIEPGEPAGQPEPSSEAGASPRLSHARLLTTLGEWRSDANAVELGYRVDNASDHRAWDIAIGFGKPDRSRLGTPSRAPAIEGGSWADLTIGIARSLYDTTDDLRLVVSWSDDAGGGVEDRPLGEPGKLPTRRQ